MVIGGRRYNLVPIQVKDQQRYVTDCEHLVCFYLAYKTIASLDDLSGKRTFANLTWSTWLPENKDIFMFSF